VEVNTSFSHLKEWREKGTFKEKREENTYAQ
jgi:hypothetical protein